MRQNRRPGPSTLTAAAAILGKDLKLELRTLETATVTAIFTTATFVVIHFAFNRDRLYADLAAGAFWVTILFASSLTINRLLSNERQQGGYEGLLLAPIDRNAIFYAKAAYLFLALTLLEIFGLALFGVMLLGPHFDPAMLALVPICLLVNLGLATIGTLISGLATATSARELLVPLMTLPLFIPVMIGASRATAPLFDRAPEIVDLGKWLGLIGLYDAVFLLLAIAVFEYILGD
ncbi:MAG: heme exporter protein CcmB [Solirubrobacterales bacterium]